jgi:hypothetical protein
VFEIGSSLREARMRHGYELPEVEAATKIRTKYLKALEDEQFDVLPAQTYIKGFLRSYAEFLGLDGQLYVDEYNSRYGGEEEEPLLRTRPQRRQSRAHRRVESRVLLLALVGIIAATALVMIAWRWGGADPATIPNLDSQPSAPVPRQRASAPVTQPAVQPRTNVELLLAAVRGNSWVAVRQNSGAGETVFEGTIERSRSMRFSGRKLWLNIARPDNLAARLNGKAVSVPRRSAPVVLVATPKGLRLVAGA